MPRMDGLAATRAIRAIESERGTQPVPIIALTGAWEEDITLSLQAGCSAHLSKPFSVDELWDALRAFWPGPLQHANGRDHPEASPHDLLVVEIPEGFGATCPDYPFWLARTITCMNTNPFSCLEEK